MSEEFLSSEDLDLRNLSWEELMVWWTAWLRQAQATNEQDAHLYSHGVFRVEPGWKLTPSGVVRDEEFWASQREHEADGDSPGR
ncbi:MAG: hypothetical protein IPJ77_02185 [Planctomycetes bacterium]|nr:hypothetical protein [Planctomycetota bacterium]